MGKEDTVIDEKAVLEILKGKPLGAKRISITSRDMFQKMRSDNRFKRAVGDDAVKLILDHFNVENDSITRRGVTRFLNSQRSEFTIANVYVRKRKYMDMSFEEDGDAIDDNDDDLDVSMSSQKSINDLDRTISDLRHQLELRDQTIRVMAENHRARVAEMEAKIKELESRSASEVENCLLENFFGHAPLYNQFKPPMRTLSMKCLSFGISSVQIRFMLAELADVLNRAENDIPSSRTLRDWRQIDMPKHNQELINEFVQRVDEISLLLDDTAMAGSEKVSAIGISEVGNESNCIVMDLCYTSAKTGDQLFDQIRDRILRQPLADMIIRKTKNLMTDMGSQQTRANRLLLDFLNNHSAREGVDAQVFSIFCGMHTGRLNSYYEHNYV